jgi:hypothetical protein
VDAVPPQAALKMPRGDRAPHYSLRVPVSTGVFAPYNSAQLFLSEVDLVDALAAELEGRLPGANPTFLKGLAILLAEGAVINWLKLAHHEMGHVYAAHDAGLTARIERLGLTEGLTRYQGNATPAQALKFQLGGLNQSETSRIFLHQESVRTGTVTFGHALANLTQAFDDSTYVAKTWMQAQRGQPWNYADPAHIRASFRGLGQDVSYRHMLAKALVADLLSSATWESLVAAGGYVAHGERVGERWTRKVGGVDVMAPDMALLRSIYGDTFRVMVGVNPGRAGAWDLRFDIRTNPQDWNVNAVGARLQRLDAVRLERLGLTFSPYLGASTRLRPTDGRGGERRTAVDLGFEFESRLYTTQRGQQVTLFGDVGTGKAYDGAMQTGMNIAVGVKFRW